VSCWDLVVVEFSEADGGHDLGAVGQLCVNAEDALSNDAFLVELVERAQASSLVSNAGFFDAKTQESITLEEEGTWVALVSAEHFQVGAFLESIFEMHASLLFEVSAVQCCLVSVKLVEEIDISHDGVVGNTLFASTGVLV